MTDTRDLPGLKLRLEAAFHLKSVLEGKPFAPITPDRLAESRDRALANRMVTTALRRHGQIDAVFRQVLAKGVPQRAGILEAVLRIAVVQLLWLDDIPAHSAIHLAVESARADKRAGRFDRLVNGVLRSVQRGTGQFQALGNDLLIPAWLATQWTGTYGADAVARFAEILVQSPPLDLTLKAPDPDLVAALGGQPVLGPTVRLMERDAAVADLAGFAEGKWWVQDVSAALPARLLNATKGEKILDLCAAPGGKTAQLASAGADVTALDISADRMERVRANLGRLGLDAEIVVADALDYAQGPVFDAVLLDAPCSATGTFRRHPEVLLHRNAQGIAERVALQRKMLAHAASLLKPGGRLVYCVCSLEADEGEAQMAWVRSNLPELEALRVVADDLDGWGTSLTPQGAVRLIPSMALPNGIDGGLDGFFIARFVKKAR
ncbi:RsmB/NOP family class I SAM-dependent RNA methyltransferase [Pelagibacterium halotolerans]|uniref:16S rRNA m(5)C 967 methyltransferase n=1 Tax=Pelagibacterium halotolerans (strain DSM 22347 / JCM 15775 / CGMCC 1.7692 / B2) TaxID=1082931 RepID=G4R6E9_PELHB|nr:RsmB/NOP family class I SAM-dependent RNA methyltransferase [Pelagibacterium halotolerans]AEQ53214.1 16S rRNA m(5)C 967 methyltransferase [Pelagibacterium halotolerans B2]QJR17151.1 methyltransferase domain-containing protein [Pelagibacterium halotolerans]SEA96065.1 16S rRNA (cytosine967-C5)-methyltransferase [Pelagibacterium halotolerans]